MNADAIPMNWQPIETAPRDGTPIIAWDGTDWQFAHWRDPKHWRKGRNGWMAPDKDSPGTYDFLDPIHPTHWLPIQPPAP